MTNMHENIGKKAKLVAMKEKMDVIYEIIAVCGNLYVCRSESGNLTRVREDDVAIININETYTEMKQRHQKEIDDFPIAFAFSATQLDKALKKINATIDECVTVFGVGDIMKKSDVHNFHVMSVRHFNEMSEAMKDTKFAEEAFLYEMKNHEYAINYDGDTEVLKCFGYSNVQELKYRGLLDAYLKARQDYIKYAEKSGII